MSTALNKPASNFSEWKSSILKEAKKRLDTIQPYRYNKILHEDSEELKTLKQLHKDFVLIPMDKAGNNIAVICMYYYISILNPISPGQKLQQPLPTKPVFQTRCRATKWHRTSKLFSLLQIARKINIHCK